MTRIKRFARTKYWPALALFIAALTIFIADGARTGCTVSAHDRLPSDYCYQMDVSISYTATPGSPPLENYAYRFPVNASGMIAAGQINKQAWDILPILGSLSNEVDLVTQDLTSTSAGWWIQLPELARNQTKTTRLYMGSNEQRRNQGILFTGADTLTATDAAPMDITNNLTLEVELELLNSDVQDATLAEHYSSNDGYQLSLVDDLGVMKVRAKADSNTCDIAWDSSWTNSNQLFAMRFVADPGNDLFLDRNGVNVAACDTDLPAITNPSGSPDFKSGTTLDNGIIRQVRLLDATTVNAHWGFQGQDMAETSWVNPTAIGTVQDYSPNNLDFTYTFNRSQTGISIIVGAVGAVSTSAEITIPSSEISILGNGFGGNIADVPVETETGILYTLFVKQIANSTGAIPPQMGYAIALGGLGMFLAVFVFMKTGFTPIALAVGGVPPALGMLNGWIPTWWMLLWAILIVASWFSIRHQEQA